MVCRKKMLSILIILGMSLPSLINTAGIIGRAVNVAKATKGKRAKISSVALATGGICFATSFVAHEINEVRLYNMHDSEKAKHRSNISYPTGYELINSNIPNGFILGSVVVVTSFVVRFPVMSLALLGAAKGACLYEEKAYKSWINRRDQWMKEQNKAKNCQP